MTNNQNTEKKIKAKISSYKSALNKEKKLHGVVGDGAGKRYLLFSLYFLLNDVKKSEEYFKWYEKEFKDDSGEPVQKLCWAVTLFRMGRLDQAEYRLADLMLSNLYVIPRILGRDIKKYEIWHSSSNESIDYFDYETYVKKNFNQIFEEQLESWMAYQKDWPQKRTYKMFKAWFNIICSDMIWDYGDGYIEHDEY